MITKETETTIRRTVAPYACATTGAAIGQLATSFGGLVASYIAIYAATAYSYWWSLALAPIAAGFLVRVFIIQHDCGHMSFFGSRRLNNIIGTICSLATLAPYASWSRQHAGHHRVWNNLDHRASGADIYSSCLTTAEYRALSPRGRLFYRALRHPVVANVLLPPLIFLVLYRTPFDMPPSWGRERRAVWLTNIALVAILAAAGGLIGFERLAIIQLPITIIASIVGVWLFSVQHRGERVAWRGEQRWTAMTAAVESSTYLRLPRVLQWFTGNIGFHHIHHLRSRIPNYRLRQCHLQIAALADVREISLWDGFGSLRLALWDEASERLVTFRTARDLP